MSQKTNEELFAAYEKLPEAIRQVIQEANTESQILDLGDKHHLRIDQVGELADEVGLLLLGFTPRNLFVPHMVTRLGVAEAAANLIAEDVNTQIFGPIQEALRQVKSPAEAGESVSELGTGKEGEKSEQKKTDNKTVFEEKLVKLFRIPREEVDLSDLGGKKATDPYAEPIGGEELGH